MSKRRITTQQSMRIQNKQKTHRESDIHNDQTVHDGLVITRFGKHAEVEHTQNKRIHCSIRPHLEALVAGDKVVWQEETAEQGVIISLYPRTSLLARFHSHGHPKPIAANITQVCIVVTEEPMLSWLLLDSYLIMIETLGLKPAIIINKIDRTSPELCHALQTTYAPLGYPVLTTGFDFPIGYQQLAQQLDNETSIFVGQSGVGKSSLIRRILPNETSIITGALSESTALGKHTTSNSTLYHIPTGGALIDSPGVREFNLTQLNVQNIAKGYIEFQPFLGECKFRNCTHIDTPHCAIIQAVNNGIILRQRYDSYVMISKQSL